MTAEIRKRALDDPEVADFVARHETYLFQEPVWGRVLAALGYPLDYWCLEEDGRIVVAQQMALVRVGFFRLLCGGLPYGLALASSVRILSPRGPAAGKKRCVGHG